MSMTGAGRRWLRDPLAALVMTTVVSGVAVVLGVATAVMVAAAGVLAAIGLSGST